MPRGDQCCHGREFWDGQDARAVVHRCHGAAHCGRHVIAVNRWTWIAMGVMPRNVIRTEDGLMVDIYLGAGFRKRRLVIKVNQSGLYDIEIGRVHRRTFEWIPEAQFGTSTSNSSTKQSATFTTPTRSKTCTITFLKDYTPRTILYGANS
jgi:hypothetical protein